MQKFVPPPRKKVQKNTKNNNNNNIIISHDENHKVHHLHPEKQKQLPQLPLKKKLQHHQQQQQQQQQQQHKTNDWHNSKDIQPPKVKLSGYLKKKRNKVGGWRKMWFVLQDQLLLSYSSKEEYDKKLVSFKDILNVVPGTIIQPLGGSRFTIETTSSQLYTFRCDDAKECTDWIAALSESLTLKSISTKDLNTVGLPQKSFNKSLDNIQQQLRKSKIRTIRNSQSCDSIVRNSRSGYNCKQSSVARIPIAESTARILERNGGVSNDNLTKNKTGGKFHLGRNCDENYDERAQIFRLHEKRLSSGAVLVNQSDEVSRINRMFSRSATNVKINTSLIKSTTPSVVTTTSSSSEASPASTTTSTVTPPIRSFRPANNNNNNGCLIKNYKIDNIENLCNNNYCSCSNCNKRNYFGKLEKPKFENLKNLDTFYLMATTTTTTTTATTPSTSTTPSTTSDHKEQIKSEKCNGCSNAGDDLRELIKKLENNCYCCVNNGGNHKIINGNIATCNCGMNLNDNDDIAVKDILQRNRSIEEHAQRLSLNEISSSNITTTTTISTPNYRNSSDGSRTRTAYTETEFPLFELENFHYSSLIEPQQEQERQQQQPLISLPPVESNSSTTSNSPIALTTPSSTELISIDNSPISSDISSTQLEKFSMKLNANSRDDSNNGFALGNGIGGRRLSASSDNLNTVVEPIYAVVDLKNKYARRARILQLQEQMATVLMDGGGNGHGKDRARPNSIHCVTSSDYEEVLNFSSECIDDSDDDNDEEDENIYEPINIPEHPYHHHHCHNQRHALWKYFPRLNIDALIEMARNRSSKTRHHRNIKQDLLPSPIENNNDNDNDHHHHHHLNHHQQRSPFSDFRKRMGNHRKSIKLRMKKFYGGTRSTCDHNSVNNSSVIIKERNAFSDDELDSQGATGSTSGTSENSLKSACGSRDRPTAAFVFNEFDKYRRGEKQFFGSLSRLKKPRTSICLDNDETSKDNKTKNITTNNNNDRRSLQQELRRGGIIRSSGRKKDACHTKFYD